MNILGVPYEFPAIPFVTAVPGGVKAGLIIRIQGKIPKRAVRFSINLASGEEIYEPLSDLGFHFNPRFDLDCVVRNSLIGGVWGKEEGESPSHLPLGRSRAFEIMIKVENEHFKVAIDGVHFLHYNHRLPIEFLNTLQILGDVKVYKLEFLDSNPPQIPTYGFQPSAIPLIEPLEIYNPVIPLVNEIPGGNRVGLVIRMHGKVPKRATEFIVNIAAGPYISDPRSDVGFHFNPRFDCGYVARNTMIEGNWGIEESDNPDNLPFSVQQTFELSILVQSLRFQVSVNGVHFLHYNHRVPIDLLNTLQILGDVRISKLEFLNLNAPVLGMSQPPVGFIEPREILNPAVPFRQVLDGGMQIGKTIFITGRPKPYANRFSINLEKTKEVPDMIFHLNPRFAGTDEPMPVIVRNHLFEGVWGKEERDTPTFPFPRGFNFDITIICEEEFYLVAVNGQHLLSFRHRVPFEIADTIYIEGDVDIMLLRF